MEWDREHSAMSTVSIACVHPLPAPEPCKALHGSDLMLNLCLWNGLPLPPECLHHLKLDLRLPLESICTPIESVLNVLSLVHVRRKRWPWVYNVDFAICQVCWCGLGTMCVWWWGGILGGGGALSCMQVRAAERTGENEVAEPAKLMGLVECTGPQCGYDALSSEPSDGLR